MGLKLKICFAAFAILLLSSSCVTRKKKGDISKFAKTYQNITAKYNGYFNANVLYEEALIKLNTQHVDNYTQVLDLYPYMAVENPKSVAPEMDKIVEKVSTVATIHHNSGWVDDCYMLAGQAQQLKQDFESAEESFAFLIDEFNPEAVKKNMSAKAKAKTKAKEKRREQLAKEDAQKLKEKEKEEIKEEKVKTVKEKKKTKEQERKQKEKQKKSKAKTKAKAKKQAIKDKKKGIKNKPKDSSELPTVAFDDKKIVKPTETPKPTESDKKTKVQGETKEVKTEKEKKERKKRKEKYFMKRPPVYKDGMVWMARNLIERQKYDEALSMLSRANAEENLTSKQIHHLAMARAYYFTKQKRYDQATEPLRNAIETSNKKKEKARLYFILGQISEKAGNQAEALSAYKKVLKNHPAYEMEFNTRLNIALSGHKSGQTDIADSRKALKRMLRDAKNLEFKDKIYYTLAKLDLETGDKPSAMANLQESLKFNTSNKVQRTEDYILLAQLFYEDGKFVFSKNYYDSTLTIMAITDERYLETKRYSNSLTDIAKHQEIVILQDSLLKIAAMDDNGKMDMARLIKKQREDAEKEAAKTLAANTPGQKNDPDMSQVDQFASINRGNIAGAGNLSAGTKSTFFAYDPKALKKGQKEFQKVWGQRELEDNWRRKKGSIASSSTDDLVVAVENAESEDKILKEILKDIPQNQTEIDAAQELLRSSMLALGRLYQTQIKDNNRSIAQLENLLERFPGCKQELEAWYFLYLAHLDKGDNPKAQVYYDLITTKYPASTYARVLSDPNYINQTIADKKKADKFYEATLELFNTGKYEEARVNIKQSSRDFPGDTKFKARYALIDAMCLGKLQGKDAYVGGLKELIAKFPNSDEERRAKEIIRLLGVESPRLITKDSTNSLASFTYAPDDVHYVLVLMDNALDKLQEYKTNVTNYNKDFHNLDKLKVTNIFLNVNESPLIVVRQFEKSSSADQYIKDALLNKDSFIPKVKDQNLYPISKENYKMLLQFKNLEDYKKFYDSNYK